MMCRIGCGDIGDLFATFLYKALILLSKVGGWPVDGWATTGSQPPHEEHAMALRAKTTVQCSPDMIGCMDLFEGASDDVIEAAASGSVVATVDKGDTILADGQDEDKAVFFVLEGRLSMLKTSMHGKECFLMDVVRGRHVGDDAVITESAQTFSVVAATDARLVSMPPSVFLQAVSCPVVQRRMCVGFVERIRAKQDHLVRLTTFDGERRVLFELARFAELTGFPSEGGYYETSVRVDQVFLAGRTGLTRETVNRAMRNLRKSGRLVLTPSGNLSVRGTARGLDAAS